MKIPDEVIMQCVVNALHHARNVSEIVVTVANEISAFTDPNKMRKNITWVTSKRTGKPYVVAYAHNHKTIQIRECNQQGKVLHDFTNATDRKLIRQAFAEL